MVAYGAFLVAGAMVAISISGWDRSKTALFSSGGAAFLMIVAAFLSTRSGALGKLGGGAGTFLPVLFAGTFFWRLTINWSKPLEADWLAANPGLALDTSKIQSPLQNWLFPTFIVGSLIAAVVIALLGRQAKAAAPSSANPNAA